MLIVAALLTCLMITVIIADMTRYIIPNWLVGIVLLAYPVMVCLTPARPDWKIALLIGLAVFVVGFILFTLNVMGGGDIKLLTALAVWTGKASGMDFFILVSVLGGGFAIGLWLFRYLLLPILDRFKTPPKLPRILKVGEPVPYGVAIAIAFLMLLWEGKVPGVVL